MSQKKKGINIIVFILGGILLTMCNAPEKTGVEKAHPRIIPPAEETRHSTPLFADMNKLLIAVADEMLNLDAPRNIKTGRRLLHVSRAYLKRISYLAFAWHQTKEEKYLEKAEELMLAAAAFPDWNPSHYLDVAEMTLALAVGYDWLYDELQPESREIIKLAIVEKGLLPSLEQEQGWVNNTNNWNQVCNGSLAIGAWAVYEDEPELSEQIIRRSTENILTPQHECDPDGVYPEGASYWDYGTGFNVLFNDAFEKIYDTRAASTEGFLKSSQFYLHVFGPRGSFNYSDGRESLGLSPAIFWFARKSGDNTLLYNQIPKLNALLSGKEKIDAKDGSNRLLAFLLTWLSEIEGELEKAPDELSWTGMGPNPISIFRSSWDEDGLFFGIKGGSPSLSHAHMDVGSFVMDANGVRWAIDLGMHDYNALESKGINIWDKRQDGERWTVFRYTNHAHNTLVIDGLLQDVNADAPITQVIAEEGRKGAVVDMTSAYSGSIEKAVRTMTMHDKSSVRIIDTITNNDAASHIRWAILTIDSIDLISPDEARIHYKDEALKVLVNSPENMQIKTYSAQPKEEWEDKNPGMIMLGFEFDLAPGETGVCDVSLLPLTSGHF